ncbi:hypothetical protein CRYUN_Cryun29cG0017200 [Craigia yunnanensis]
MDLDEGAEAIKSFMGRETVAVLCERDSIVEPYEGMEFDSEDAAKIFYDEYAQRVGFVIRVMSCRRSERDRRILARQLGCNKEGYCVSIRVAPREARQTMVSCSLCSPLFLILWNYNLLCGYHVHCPKLW